MHDDIHDLSGLSEIAARYLVVVLGAFGGKWIGSIDQNIYRRAIRRRLGLHDDAATESEMVACGIDDLEHLKYEHIQHMASRFRSRYITDVFISEVLWLTVGKSLFANGPLITYYNHPHKGFPCDEWGVWEDDVLNEDAVSALNEAGVLA